MEKKCIINTTKSLFSQMLECVVRTLDISVVIQEKNDLEKLFNEVSNTMRPFIIFEPHIFSFELEKVCKQIISINQNTMLICICINTCNKFLGLRLYKSGVNCIISDLDSSKQLLSILKNAFEGLNYYPAEVLDAVEKREHILMKDYCSDLSRREIEVLYEFSKKHPIKVISKKLKIAESTVSTTLHRIRLKLGVDTKEDAVELALKQGIF